MSRDARQSSFAVQAFWRPPVLGNVSNAEAPGHSVCILGRSRTEGIALKHFVGLLKPDARARCSSKAKTLRR
jgi:hypothetical protein